MMPHRHEIHHPEKKGQRDPAVEDPLRKELGTIRKNNQIRRSRLDQVSSGGSGEGTVQPLHLVKH
jgi:hypothetical protein